MNDRAVDVGGLYRGLWRVALLPDGRVAALVWMIDDDPQPAAGKGAIWADVQEDWRWRVDEDDDMIALPGQERPVYVADLVEGPPGATPLPSP